MLFVVRKPSRAAWISAGTTKIAAASSGSRRRNARAEAAITPAAIVIARLWPSESTDESSITDATTNSAASATSTLNGSTAPIRARTDSSLFTTPNLTLTTAIGIVRRDDRASSPRRMPHPG